MYGDNQTLAVKAGQWVTQDQVTDTSGTSPNNDTAGLYFELWELWQEGEAENPSLWLISPLICQFLNKLKLLAHSYR